MKSTPTGMLVGVGVVLAGCHHMQTRPSCSLEPYAIIEFINFTDTNKVTYAQRYYDGEPLGEPITNVVEARTNHRYRVPPGIYEFGVRMLDGTIRAWKTKRALWACEAVTIPMALKRKNSITKEDKIHPRREEQ
jgi:hypothetical protein